VASVS